MFKLDDFALWKAQLSFAVKDRKITVLDWPHWYHSRLDIDRYGARHLILITKEPLSEKVLERLNFVLKEPLERGFTEGGLLVDELHPFELKYQMFTVWTNFGGIEQVREEKEDVAPKAK